jgi:hypothetical protein
MKTFFYIIITFFLSTFIFCATFANTNEASLPGNRLLGKVIDQTSGTRHKTAIL